VGWSGWRNTSEGRRRRCHNNEDLAAYCGRVCCGSAQRRLHALAALAHGSVRKPYRNQRQLLSGAQIHFHRNRISLDSKNGGRLDAKSILRLLYLIQRENLVLSEEFFGFAHFAPSRCDPGLDLGAPDQSGGGGVARERRRRGRKGRSRKESRLPPGSRQSRQFPKMTNDQ